MTRHKACRSLVLGMGARVLCLFVLLRHRCCRSQDGGVSNGMFTEVVLILDYLSPSKCNLSPPVDHMLGPE